MFIALATALSCSSSYQGTDYAATLTAITVSPDTVDLITGQVPADELAVQFQATGTYSDGTVQDLGLVAWTLSNQSAGAIDETGLFLPAELNGGRTWITARLAGLEGTAEATVVLQQVVNDEGVDTALFTGDAALLEDAWTYPEDGVNVPRNTPSLEFQWHDLGAQAYALRLVSPLTDTTVYTTDTAWKAEDEWPIIAGTNAGGSLEVTLTALQDDGLWTTTPNTIQVNRMDAFGSIYYWTSSTRGFMRLPYGSSEPESYMNPVSEGTCVGCHAISSTGMLGFTYGTTTAPLGLYDIVEDEAVLTEEDGAQGRFKTFSPDGTWLLAAKDASLVLYDGVTGEELSTLDLAAQATQPDWSPLGDRVAVTLVTSHNHDVEITGGRVALLEHLGNGEFGEIRVLVEPEEPVQAFYPTFSPDGRWIAFNQSTGDGYDDPDAELWVVSVDGGEPIRLDAANQGPELTNSWPHWAPLPDDDVLWLAFSSRRPYGEQVDGEPQVWISAFDPALADALEDPSWPAFWLPGQSTEHNNHLPVWVDDGG